MSYWKEIKSLTEERGQIQKSIYDLVKETGGKFDEEQEAKYDKMHEASEQRSKEIQRLEQLQSEKQDSAIDEVRAMIGRDDINQTESKSEDRSVSEQEAMRAWLANDMSAEHRSLLGDRANGQELQLRAISKGSKDIGNQLFGGVVIPVKDYSGVLQAGATVMPTSDGNPLPFLRITDTSNSADLKGEAGSVTATDATEANVTLNAYKYSTLVLVSSEYLKDAAFDAQREIFNYAAKRVGRAINVHFTTGNDSDKPNGFVTAASTGETTAATGAITFAEWMNFIHSLDPSYRQRQGVKIQLHDNVLKTFRQMTDDQSRPLWDYRDGTILGYEYVVNNDMADTIEAAANVAAIGDFSEYRVRRVTPPVVKRVNELYAANDQVGFFVHERFDGDLVDTSAVKLLTMSAS